MKNYLPFLIGKMELNSHHYTENQLRLSYVLTDLSIIISYLDEKHSVPFISQQEDLLQFLLCSVNSIATSSGSGYLHLMFPIKGNTSNLWTQTASVSIVKKLLVTCSVYIIWLSRYYKGVLPFCPLK